MSFSKKVLSLCSVVLLFMAVVAGLYWDNYFFIIKKTKVDFLPSSVNESVKEEAEQKAELALKNLKGKNIWKMNLETVRSELLENKWIESVSIKRELPDVLRVEMKFRNVAFLYVDSKQALFPLAADGTLLNSVAVTQAPDVPVIKNARLARNKELVRHLVNLFNQLPHEGLLSARNVAQVDWTVGEGFKVELNNSEDGFIVIGVDQVSMKAKRIESVLKYLESQKQRWRVIDASFSKKVLVRLRKRS